MPEKPKFEVGDKVMATINGPTMLVDEVFDAGGLRYRCSWFTTAYELAGGVFPECSLRSASMKRK